MGTEFLTATGAASTNRPTEVLGKADQKRYVSLVLDNSDWVIELTKANRTYPPLATRAKMPFTGVLPIILPPKQGLYVWARLATGASATQWELSVFVSDEQP